MMKKNDVEYVLFFNTVEKGILGAVRIAEKEKNIRLTDKMALQAVKKVIREIRGFSIGTFQSEGESLIYNTISQFLEDFLDANEEKYTDEDALRILKHVMKSIKIRSEIHGSPDGYLRFLEEFMEETGTNVELLHD